MVPAGREWLGVHAGGDLDQGGGVLGLDESELAGGDCDAGLAAAVDGVDGGGFGC